VETDDANQHRESDKKKKKKKKKKKEALLIEAGWSQQSVQDEPSTHQGNFKEVS
jgi:hypothetical protein